MRKRTVNAVAVAATGIKVDSIADKEELVLVWVFAPALGLFNVDIALLICRKGQ